MPSTRKLVPVNGGSSFGITLPKDELRLAGILDRVEAGEEVNLVVEELEPGRWGVELAESWGRRREAEIPA